MTTKTNYIPKIETILPPNLGRAVQLKYSADGTNYEIIAIECPNGYTNGYSCLSSPAILILSGYNKSSYAFSRDNYISWDYVWEKLCPNDSRKDAQNLTVLITEAQQILKGK